MDLLFFGSGAFGLPTLQALAKRHAIRAIITQPDRPAGRGGRLTPTPIAAWAAVHLSRTTILKPEDVNTQEVLAALSAIESVSSISSSLRSAAPSVHLPAVVIAFGQKLGRPLLERRFAINLHASLLPRWRGAAPINAAILAGDTEVGNSIITLANRMDAGLILAQSRRDLPPHQTAGELHDLLAADGPDLMLGILTAFEKGSLTPRQQDEALATRAPKLSKADGWLNFADRAENCRRRIHGLTPWPGIVVQHRAQGGPGQNLPLFKVTRVQIADIEAEEEPGTVLDPDEGLVACGCRTGLRLLEVHPAGKRRMSWPDFHRGNPCSTGDRLVSTVPPPDA